MTVRSLETDHALFTRSTPDLLEIQLKPGVRVDVALIASIMRDRKRLCGKAPLCILALASTDAEVDIAALGMDHYKANESADGIQAVALVSGSLIMETMVRLYAAYFPPAFRLEVFGQEAEARAWMAEQLAEFRPAGQNA